jgi:hypothetical protein
MRLQRELSEEVEGAFGPGTHLRTVIVALPEHNRPGHSADLLREVFPITSLKALAEAMSARMA